MIIDQIFESSWFQCVSLPNMVMKINSLSAVQSRYMKTLCFFVIVFFLEYSPHLCESHALDLCTISWNRSPPTFDKSVLQTFQTLMPKFQDCCIACCLGRECIFVSVQTTCSPCICIIYGFVHCLYISTDICIDGCIDRSLVLRFQTAWSCGTLFTTPSDLESWHLGYM